jgi:hypothetical protein
MLLQLALASDYGSRLLERLCAMMAVDGPCKVEARPVGVLDLLQNSNGEEKGDVSNAKARQIYSSAPDVWSGFYLLTRPLNLSDIRHQNLDRRPVSQD